MKLKSFSTLELTVALLLTGLLIGFAYSGFSYMTRHYFRNNTKLDVYEEMNRLNYLMEKDFFLSDKVIMKEDQLIMEYKKENIVYAFDSFILRTQGEVTDTFHIAAEEIYFGLMNQQQFIPGELVDEFRFTLLHEKKEYPMAFSKTYATDELLNILTSHGH